MPKIVPIVTSERPLDAAICGKKDAGSESAMWHARLVRLIDESRASLVQLSSSPAGADTPELLTSDPGALALTLLAAKPPRQRLAGSRSATVGRSAVVEAGRDAAKANSTPACQTAMLITPFASKMAATQISTSFASARTMNVPRVALFAVLLAALCGESFSHRLGATRIASQRLGSTRSRGVAMVVEYGPEMHSEQLYAFGAVTGMTAVGYQIWEKILVPQKRLELSRSKRGGEVKQLLDEIEAAPNDRALERWFFSDWIEARSGTQAKKKAAVPFLPKTKFNSGDNPVIGAVAAIMLIGILSSSVKEAVHVIGPLLSR